MSSRAFPIIFAIFALFCGSLASISAFKNSTAPIYVRYVRRRPPWFPGDLYVEEVVEEFRTKSKPPMFGSSEIEIQRFLERDQKLQEAKAALRVEVETNSTTSVKGDKRKIGTLRQVKKPAIEKLKPTITVTVYKPSDSLEMRVSEFITHPEPCTTTMKVPYTHVITNSAEIDYYDVDEGRNPNQFSTSTAKTTTKKTAWKMFESSTQSPTTKTTAKSFWRPFASPTASSTTAIPSTTTPRAKTTTTMTPRSLWLNFGQTKPISRTTTERPTTTQRSSGIFNFFGKSVPSTTTETPTTITEFFEEPTTTEFLTTFLDSASEDETTTSEISTMNNLDESIETVTFAPTEGSIVNLDDDYVNGEIVDSNEEDHTATPSLNTEPTSTEQSETVVTTTKKAKLFGWFG